MYSISVSNVSFYHNILSKKTKDYRLVYQNTMLGLV